jgi:stalled ribosome rescue protein Dom34
VWLDREHADVFHVFPTDQVETVLRGSPQRSVRMNGGSDEHYFHEVAHALGHARRILVVGPGSAKLSLVRHIVHHDQHLEPRVVGIETVEDLGDEHLMIYVREYLE